jgi:hypothetical protein
MILLLNKPELNEQYLKDSIAPAERKVIGTVIYIKKLDVLHDFHTSLN